MRRLLLVALVAGGVAACFGARSLQRSYFVLHGPSRDPVGSEPLIRGLVRVRNMDTDRVYEKFQIVVRRSPYQLRYSDANVWAVKPNQMVSDVAAQSLQSAGVFSAVTRELLEARPRYTLAGQLHAIEVYDSEDLWFAHLSLSLYLSRFADGERLWSYDFDERKRVNAGDFGHAVRALSELLQQALTEVVEDLARLNIAKTERLRTGPEEASPPPPPPPEEDEEVPDPIIIPEDARGPRAEDEADAAGENGDDEGAEAAGGSSSP